MKTILVPVEQHDLIEPTLETACHLARRFDSYVEGFWLAPNISPFLGADAMGAGMLYDANLKPDEELQSEGQLIFERAMQAHGFPQHSAASSGPSYGWTKQEATGDNFLAAYGRVFDITVLGRPGSKPASPRMSTLEAALFETGRPVLMAPPSSARGLGENILIAWNASTETARTVALAMPLLTRAAKVTILSIEGYGASAPNADQLQRQLQRHDIGADVIRRDGGQPVGEIILREAGGLDCDLLIKGAYTQARLRQFIFGGATRHIVSEASLPVFMAH